MGSRTDESEDPSLDGIGGTFQTNPYNSATGESDNGVSLRRGTRDAEEDHQGEPVDPNQQPVEPNGQDEANTDAAQEEEEVSNRHDEGNPGAAQEGEAGGAEGGFDIDYGLRNCSESPVIMSKLPVDPREKMLLVIWNAMRQHSQSGHMLAERETNARARGEDID